MTGIQALREHRTSLVAAQRHQLAEIGSRVWSADEQDAYADRGAQIERLTQQIEAHERLLKQEAEDKWADAEQFRYDLKDPANSPRALYAKFLRDGPNALSRDEMAVIRNTMSTGTGNQGGYTVQTTIASELIDILKAYGGVRGVASSISTAQGNPMSYPTSDGTSEVGEWIPENTTATAQDPTFGTVSLNVFKAGSKVIAVPIELLQDSQIDVVGMITKRIGERIGRTLNAGFTTGTGSGQPNGFVTAASTGKTGTTGQTTTVIYDDLVDLQESIDYAYQQGGTCRWMMHQQTRKVIRKLKDANNRPVWIDSWDAGVTQGTAGSLLGMDVVINNDMAQPGANAKTIAYGDFSKYMIRDVMEMTILRFDDSAYAKLGQVGFLAWTRCGGNLLDTNGIKLYAHSAT